MANWDEHAGIQSIINMVLIRVTLNPVIFLIIGIFQHLILDNLVVERPINLFSRNRRREFISLSLAILGVLVAISSDISLYCIIGLFGSILPDILEGLRLLMAKDGKQLWMTGDSQAFHIDLGIDTILSTRRDFNKDIKRRVIILSIISVIILVAKLG